MVMSVNDVIEGSDDVLFDEGVRRKIEKKPFFARCAGSDCVPLSNDEQLLLCDLAKSGDDVAFQKIILSYQRLAVKIVNEFLRRGVNETIDAHDLFSEANLGIAHAIRVFDKTRSPSVTCVVDIWIRNKIRCYIACFQSEIAVPSGYLSQVSKLIKNEELSEEDNKFVARMPKRISGNEEYILGFIPVEIEKETLLEEDQKLRVAQLLSDMKDSKMQSVLQYRYGFNGDGVKTLQEIGVILGLTRERVRQILDSALNALRPKIAACLE